MVDSWVMWVGSLDLPFINNVTLSKLLNFSETISSHVKLGLIVYMSLACFEN